MKIQIKRILCATDLSDFSNSAVIQAIGMAKEFGSTLFICHVIDLPLVTMHGAAFVYPEDQIEEMRTGAMDQIKGLVKDSALNWEAVVETGPVSSTLCGLAAEKQADLAIVSTGDPTAVLAAWVDGSQMNCGGDQENYGTNGGHRAHEKIDKVLKKGDP